MTVTGELSSVFWTPSVKVSPVPLIGAPAPRDSQLSFADNRPTLLVFLRHCGCAFAEKTFRQLYTLSSSHPEIDFLAVSQGDKVSTEHWLSWIHLPTLAIEKDTHQDTMSKQPNTNRTYPDAVSVPKQTLPANLNLILNPGRELFGRYGLGLLNFTGLFSMANTRDAYHIQIREKIRNQPTESGSRWQKSGVFSIDEAGFIKWSWISDRATELCDLSEAVDALYVK